MPLLFSHLQGRVQSLRDSKRQGQLTQVLRGIERESLRVTDQGTLAQTPHPAKLGAALTHSSITTDYSEALMEFITGVDSSVKGSLSALEDVHSFVCQNLDGEQLWPASMPCEMGGEDSIPVA